MQRVYYTSLTILLAICLPLWAQRPVAEPNSPDFPTQSPSARELEAMEAPAAGFVENRGQFDPAIQYKLASPTNTVWLTTTGIVLDAPSEASQPLAKPTGPGLSERFVGANRNIVLKAADPCPGTHGYLTNKDATKLPIRTFLRVEYKDVWPGISVRLCGNPAAVRQSFVIQAGADPGNIALSYTGIGQMTIDEHGSLVIDTPQGTLREVMPAAYQEVSGHRIALPGHYKLTAPGTYGFHVDGYAREYPLVIGTDLPTFLHTAAPPTGAPLITYFNVAPASTLPGQAAIGTFLVTGATSATLNGIIGNCVNGSCGGTVIFDPTVTTNYVLDATGAGGNTTASQQVEVGQYLPNPPPDPAGLQVTWQNACWYKGRKASFQGMAFDLNVPAPPVALPLEATLYLNSTICNPSSQDNLNDTGTLTGSGSWIFWFIHHPNKKNTSAIWTIGNQSSGCVSYANAPKCP